MNLPKNVRTIINTLERAGFEGYAVGGCVRDTLLQKEPNDWDITTNAAPLQVKSLFSRTIDTGIRHGTVTVLLDGESYEVTTYRIDGEYEDCRHPKEVTFTASLLEDLKRRDFTINAMAYNDAEGIVDAFGGMQDLKDHVIRCVGDPANRFAEDALRMMRAVRFSGQLGYEIEEKTGLAAKASSHTLSKISAERICVELTKLMLSPHPDYLKKAYEFGMTGVFLPEFDKCMETRQNNPHHCYNVGEHILHSLTFVRADRILRLTMLFHDLGKAFVRTVDEEGIDHFHGHVEKSAEIADKRLKSLRFDNDTREKVVRLVRYHDLKIAPDKKAVRRAIVKVGEDLFPLLLEVKHADYLSQSMYKREEKEDGLRRLKEIYLQILEEKDCISMKDLAVNGRDLIALGIQPGKKIGEELQRLFELVLEDPSQNTRENLLSHISLSE